MSVVVRSPHTGQIIVYTKGADSSIYPQLGDPRSEGNIVNSFCGVNFIMLQIKFTIKN